MNNKNLAGMLILGLLLSFSPKISAQCPSGDIVLSSQAEVNTFVADYGSCTALTGSITIGDYSMPMVSSDINDISGLSSLTSIGGDLLISTNPTLASLAGLENLSTIGGSLRVNDNDNLSNLWGLNALTSVGHFLSISDNDGITNINNLNNLDVTFNVLIKGNSSLSTITGFNNLDVQRALIISENANLTSITGLNNHNPGLTIAIMDNILLSDVSGLSVVGAPAPLTVSGNHALNICTADGLCLLINTPGLPHSINDNGTNCSTVLDIQIQCLSALPVSLISFDANKLGNNVQLNWTTAQERDNAGFFIQYSTDAQNWVDLAFINGQGNSDRINDYDFLHESVNASKNYYRLKQLDYGGLYSLSEVQIVRFNASIKDQQIAQVYPNPSTGQINIQFEPQKNTNSLLILSDIRGQIIWEKQLAPEGTPNVLFQQLDLPTNQMYFLFVQTGSDAQVMKIQTIDSE